MAGERLQKRRAELRRLNRPHSRNAARNISFNEVSQFSSVEWCMQEKSKTGNEFQLMTQFRFAEMYFGDWFVEKKLFFCCHEVF